MPLPTPLNAPLHVSLRVGGQVLTTGLSPACKLMSWLVDWMRGYKRRVQLLLVSPDDPAVGILLLNKKEPITVTRGHIARLEEPLATAVFDWAHGPLCLEVDSEILAVHEAVNTTLRKGEESMYADMRSKSNPVRIPCEAGLWELLRMKKHPAVVNASLLRFGPMMPDRYRVEGIDYPENQHSPESHTDIDPADAVFLASDDAPDRAQPSRDGDLSKALVWHSRSVGGRQSAPATPLGGRLGNYQI